MISSLGDIGSPTKGSSKLRDTTSRTSSGILGRNAGMAGSGSKIGTPSPLKVERRSNSTAQGHRGGRGPKEGIEDSDLDEDESPYQSRGDDGIEGTGE